MQAILSDDAMQLQLVADGVEAKGIDLPNGDPLTKWLKRIRSAGIIKGLDLEKIKSINGSTNDSQQGQFIIAQGLEPVHEKHQSRIYFPTIKSTQADEHITNFRDRGFGTDVHEGQLLAETIFEGPGQDGYNVLGERIAYKTQGEVIEFSTNQNVLVERNGNTTQYLSRIDGVLDNRDPSVLHIEEALLIHGTLDFNIGNLRSSRSITIEGDILDGFSVQTQQDLTVRGTVEKGVRLEAEGAITIEGGISSGAQLKSGADIRLKFGQGIEINCGRDLHIEQYLFDSTCTCGGTLHVHGKGSPQRGALIGGSHNAIQGMNIVSLGSSTTITSLAAGVNLKLEKEMNDIQVHINSIRQDLKRMIRQLPFNITCSDWRTQLSNLALIPKQKALLQLHRIKELKEEMAHLQGEHDKRALKRPKDDPETQILINSLIPDVHLRIGKLNCKVFTNMGPSIWKRKGGSLNAYIPTHPLQN